MSQFTINITANVNIGITFTETYTVTITVGQGGSVTVGDITIDPGAIASFEAPTSKPFVFQVNPLPNYVVAVIIDGQVIQPDA